LLDYSGGFLLEDLYRPSGARSIKAAWPKARRASPWA